LVAATFDRATDLDTQQIRHRAEAYVNEIQATLKEYIAANPPLAGMGTTWTSAHLLPPHAVVVHLGDSRAYWLQQGELHQVTRDDTISQAYLEAGVDPATARKFRHILLNSFGGEIDNVTAQIYLLAIAPGDKLLLCTDGLTEMVDDNEIATILRQAPAPQAACDQLIRAALDHGGIDNVTAVVAFAAAAAECQGRGLLPWLHQPECVRIRLRDERPTGEEAEA
jgi:protein phosphatase